MLGLVYTYLELRFSQKFDILALLQLFLKLHSTKYISTFNPFKIQLWNMKHNANKKGVLILGPGIEITQ